MEVSVVSVAIVSILITWAWRVVNWVWLRPKKLEAWQQGLKGNSYRLLFGDFKESSMMLQQANSKPINLSTSHDITLRVIPFLHHTVNTYGKNSFMWVGPIPRVNIMNPEDLKDIFNKYDDFEKPVMNPLRRLLSTGLPNYEGEKWAKHRKIISPAFHSRGAKAYVTGQHFTNVCDKMINEWWLVCKEGSCELDVWPCLDNLTADVLFQTSFGSTYEERMKIFQLLKE